MALIAVLMRAPKRQQSQQQSHGFDVIGFLLVATSSVRSRSCSTVAWRTTGLPRPSSTRQFGACFVVMLITGAILLATTQFLPQLVQQNFGYTATWPGSCSRRAAYLRRERASGRELPRAT
jgi:DHA2 family multidrug resistance protein